MKTLQVREAKAAFSALVEAAERGEPTTITRHGRPAAVVVPVSAAETLYPEPSFADFLLSYPGGVDIPRDDTSLEAADLSDPGT
ncbi:MAG: type II toxin-antitoxin system Phd/YefM family antitoxin [Litorimonas sp.]